MATIPKTKLSHLLDRNVDDIIPNRDHLLHRLEEGSLRIKHGVDPTKPDLHLGHAVALWKLKEFQEAGHIVIFLIGDYTARIGDPSGRNTARPVLSPDEIDRNAKTYLDQVGKILDVSKCEIHHNSEWFEKMTFAELIKLLGQTTVAQIIEREDFQARLKQGIDIGTHEIIYPIMQGYDSVQLKCDVEIGGVDQKLNMLMGRDLQRKFGQTEQEVMIVPLLLGTDGVKKMSKSLGNYISIAEPATEQFGKIMSIPDSLVLDYWKLCTNASDTELESIADELKSGANPRDIKVRLAKTIVTMYHDATAADKADKNFTATFQKNELPEDLPLVPVSPNPTTLVDLLLVTRLVESKSEARRMVEQNAVKIDQQLMTDPDQQISPQAGMVVQVGKRKFAKLQ